MFRSNLDSTVRSIQGYSQNVPSKISQPTQSTLFVATVAGSEDPPIPVFASERK